jgi:hypothetical protein
MVSCQFGRFDKEHQTPGYSPFNVFVFMATLLLYKQKHYQKRKTLTITIEFQNNVESRCYS